MFIELKQGIKKSRDAFFHLQIHQGIQPTENTPTPTHLLRNLQRSPPT